MDLAGTPALPGRAPYRPHTRAERPWVRLLSPAEAAAPEFVEAWTALAQDAAEPNPFFEPWFLLPSLAQFAQGRRCLVLAQGEAGQRPADRQHPRPPGQAGPHHQPLE